MPYSFTHQCVSYIALCFGSNYVNFWNQCKFFKNAMMCKKTCVNGMWQLSLKAKRSEVYLAFELVLFRISRPYSDLSISFYVKSCDVIKTVPYENKNWQEKKMKEIPFFSNLKLTHLRKNTHVSPIHNYAWEKSGLINVKCHVVNNTKKHI